MIRLVELAGFAGVAGTVYAFLGMIGHEYQWQVFLASAGVSVAAIVYRRVLRSRQNDTGIKE